MKKLFLTMLFFVGFVAIANADITFSGFTAIDLEGESGVILTYEAVSDGSGDVTATSLGTIKGRIEWVDVNPDETDTPTTLFDVFLYNDNSAIKRDMLSGDGEDLAVNVDTRIMLKTGGSYSLPLDSVAPYFVASGMGDTKKAIIRILVLK